MILYSIIPVEIVFGNNDKDVRNFIEIDYLGERVEVEPLENNCYIINRILSTSPKAFLNPGLQPGSIIRGSYLRG